MTRIEDIISPLLTLKQHLVKLSTNLQNYKLKSARLKAQSDQLHPQSQASLLTLMSMVRANERRKNEKLKINTTNEVDDMSNDEFEVETNEDFKLEKEVQDSTTQGDQDFTRQDNHDSPY
jgi:hypothetical protein